jgi:putative lipoic acid-binding regulatory protein
MQGDDAVGQGGIRTGSAEARSVYPAEVHFSIIVTDDCVDDLALAQVLASRVVTRPLRAGNQSCNCKYRSLTLSVMVSSRDELDGLDRDLRSVRGVKLLL